MKIAFATFSSLPNPPAKGGAVEALIDDICLKNEEYKNAEIDVFSVFDEKAKALSENYNHTRFCFYKNEKSAKLSFKNIFYKLFKVSILDTNMRKIVKLINKADYDFVIITSINRELKSIFKKIKSKTIWYLHADALSVLPIKDLKGIAKECDEIIGVSNFVSNRIASVCNFKKVETVLNCSDIVPVKKEEEKATRLEFRNKIGIKPNDKLISYIGRITPIKGILELVNAFVKAGLSDAKLLIVGSPSDKEQEKYYVKLKMAANENVFFLKYVPHYRLNEVYCASDIIAAPSICNEAAGLVVIESIICDRPIITTNMGGIPEYTAGADAVIVKVDEYFEDSLQNAIKETVAFERSIHHINKEKFSTDNFYHSFIKTIEKLLEVKN